jgi:hypothetical protein
MTNQGDAVNTMGYRITTKGETVYGDDKHVVLYHTERPAPEAELAFAFIERWAMVAGMPDGEDSGGRQKLRLMNPSELVERAFSVARLAMDAARESGLMLQLPDLNEINSEVDAKREEKRKAKVDA